MNEYNNILKNKLKILSEEYDDILSNHNEINSLQILTDLYNSIIFNIMGNDKITHNSNPSRLTYETLGFKYNSELEPENNIFRINFDSLYANTLVKLYEEKKIVFENEDYGKLITTIIKLKNEIRKEFSNTNVWTLTKILINLTYHQIHYNSYFKVFNSHMITSYCHNTFKTLITMLPNNIIKINVNLILILDYEHPRVKKIVDHLLNLTGLKFKIEQLD
jgi:hypothetical protein